MHVYVCIHVLCAFCERKLHKDEVHRQKEKASNTSVDDDSGSDMEIDHGFSIPGRIWSKLYRWITSVEVI